MLFTPVAVLLLWVIYLSQAYAITMDKFIMKSSILLVHQGCLNRGCKGPQCLLGCTCICSPQNLIVKESISKQATYVGYQIGFVTFTNYGLPGYFTRPAVEALVMILSPGSL